MTIFPARLYAGITTKVSLALSPAKGYPKSDGWELVLFLRNIKGALSRPLTWQDNSHWILTLDADDLNAISDSSLIPTQYELMAIKPQGQMTFPYVLNTQDETHSIETGRLNITRSLNATSGAVDARTHNERVLDNIRAVIEKSATKEQERYMVNGVELWRRALSDLLELEKVYASRVAVEKRREMGLSPFSTIQIAYN